MDKKNTQSSAEKKPNTVQSEPDAKKPEQKAGAVEKASGKKLSESPANAKPEPDAKKPEQAAKPELDAKKPEQKAGAVEKASGKKLSESPANAKPEPDAKKPEQAAKPELDAKKPEQKAIQQASDSKPSESKVKSEPSKKPLDKEEIKLNSLYAFKLAMSSIYTEKGQVVPVTFLQFKPWLVSQIKKKEKEGYNSVQLACVSGKKKACSKVMKNHLSSAGLSEKPLFIREIKEQSVDHIKVGQVLSINSLQKGDRVKLQAVSKGHGFAGVVKRWGFKGGPASHGSKTHRTGGSIGNRTEPARVMPGKKMAGHYGVEKTSLKNVQIMDVISSENLIVVKGPVPGARKGLVLLSKMEKQ